MSEAICPTHGPYQSELGSCPYCARISKRPSPPASLGDDDSPTDVFGQAGIRQAYTSGPRWDNEDGDDEQTQMPGKQRSSSRHPDDDDADMTVVDRPQTGMLGWLIVKSGGRYGHVYKIKPGAIIGRDMRKADMVVDDEKVSGLHAKIIIKNEQFVLLDLGSSNGTHLNGQEILGATAIKENDEIRIGNIVFVLKTLC
jgi:hypothetical protein